MTMKGFMTVKLCSFATHNGPEETRRAVGRAGEGYCRGELVKGVLKIGGNRDEEKWVEGAR